MSAADSPPDAYSVGGINNLVGSHGARNMDSELASIVSSLSALSNVSAQQQHGQIGSFRRRSVNSNNGSEVDSEVFFHGGQNSPILKRTTLSVGAAPIGSGTGAAGAAGAGINSRLNMLGNYSASVTGGMLQHQSQQGGFFERFGRSLAEGTREVELNLGRSSGRASRRESLGTMESFSRVPETSTSSSALPLAYSGDDRRPSVSSDALESLSENLVLQNEIASAGPQAGPGSQATERTTIWNVASAPVFKPQATAAGIASPSGGAPDGTYAPQDMMFEDAYAFPYVGFQGAQLMSMMPPGVPPTAGPMGMPPGGAFMPPPPHPSSMESASNNPSAPISSDPHQPGFGATTIDGTPPPTSQDQDQPRQHRQQQLPPFIFPNNPYLFFPPNAANAPIPSEEGPHSRPGSKMGHRNGSKPDATKSHGNPYLHNSRGTKNGSPANLNGLPVFNTPQPRTAPNSSSNNTGRGKKNAIPRSPLLEEFRNNSNKRNYTIEDIFGSALEFCKDQHGSRFIQQELAKASDTQKEVVFNEIREEAIPLSDDVFGNYVIQKFFEHGLEVQKNVLYNQFKGKMEKLSMQMYACRVIQRALECIREEQKIALVDELMDCVLPMIKDQNGNHVIQKAIECISMEKLPFILKSLHGQIYHLSTHAYGCRVVQRLLEYGRPEDQDQILNELDQFIPYLIEDQYGNYVIQHILQHGSVKADQVHIAKTKQEIVDNVSKNVVEFSKHKFASNVVEKSILYGTAPQKRLLMDKILPRSTEHAQHLEDSAPLVLMMRDQYANYVVQKLVGVTTGEDKRLIVITIKSYLDKLNKINSQGSRHLASVEKLAALVDKL